MTAFDLDEGMRGRSRTTHDSTRLLAEKGDELWYEYDFGDGWDHKLVVEEVLDDPPATAWCTVGRMACPPEDCGGIGGYEELATWVCHGYDDALLPGNFDDAAIRCGHDPKALWRHVVGRLPLGTKDAERHAGWTALAVAGSGVPAQEWHHEISDLLFALGWRSGADRFSPPPAHSPTLNVLDQLAGAARVGLRPVGNVDFAVAATARAVIVPG